MHESEPADRTISAQLLHAFKPHFPFLAIAGFLAPEIISSGWSGNEIFYYGVADRWVNPAEYTEMHAIKDGSIARAVSFLLIGSTTHLLGFEASKLILSAFLLIAYVFAFWRLARALGLGLIGGISGLAMYLLAQQTLMSGSYVFSGVEPKTLAYCCVLLGVAFAVEQRVYLALFCMVIATYFHFLVGAFWGGAIIGLLLLQKPSWVRLWQTTSLFTAMCLPLALAIVQERLAGSGVDTSGLDMSLNQIYAEFRVPHHVAPFLETHKFLVAWLPGVLTHGVIGLSILISIKVKRRKRSDASIAIWIAILNPYVLLAMIVAFFDRSSHHLSVLYLFRPTALILLLTLLCAIKYAATSFGSRTSERLKTSLTAILALATIGQAGIAVYNVTIGRAPLIAAQTPTTTRMIEWVDGHTPTDASFLISAAPSERIYAETREPWLGLERLLRRPTVVSFKFVPSTSATLLKWYERLRWRDEFFAGSCEMPEDLEIDYLIIEGAQTVDKVRACSITVWRENDLFVQQVTRTGGDQ